MNFVERIVFSIFQKRKGTEMEKRRIFLRVILLLFVLSFAGKALSAENGRDFENIKSMNLKQLTSESTAALEKKYAKEDWEKYKFPEYVYVNNTVMSAYKIAVKEAILLAKFPCYCSCEAIGHKNLSYCFLEKGNPGRFDDHGAACNICINQALMAFLWKETGAADAEILKGFKEIYPKE